MRNTSTITMLLMLFYCLPSHAFNSGLYVGGSVGLQNLLTDNVINENDQEDGDVSQVRLKLGQSAFAGSIFGGYKKNVYERWFFSIQADFLLSGNKAKINSVNIDGGDGEVSTTQQFTQLKNGFGISIRPGVQLNPQAQGFVMVGYRRAKMNYNINSVDDDPFYFHRALYNDGIEYGIGTEIDLNSSLALRLEITQSRFSNKQIFDIPANGRFASKSTINQGMLSLVYYPNIV